MFIKCEAYGCCCLDLEKKKNLWNSSPVFWNWTWQIHKECQRCSLWLHSYTVLCISIHKAQKHEHCQPQGARLTGPSHLLMCDCCTSGTQLPSTRIRHLLSRQEHAKCAISTSVVLLTNLTSLFSEMIPVFRIWNKKKGELSPSAITTVIMHIELVISKYFLPIESFTFDNY